MKKEKLLTCARCQQQFDGYCLAGYRNCPSCRYNWYNNIVDSDQNVKVLLKRIGEEMVTVQRCPSCPSYIKCVTIGVL